MSKANDELRAMEDKWRSFWETDGTYRYDPARGREETFVIDTPPPTVSGSLHIGHVFSYTQTDLMARYRRMRGDNVFYPMGWDDNGLPTERRVQNVFNVRCDPSLPYDPNLKLEAGRQGESLAVSRQNFIEACDVLVVEDEKQFMDLWQRLGLSIDWNETYATIDERCRYVSQLSFLRLVEKGEAELREAPTMWDVDWQSAVAQAEVQDREKEGAFYKLRFEVQGGHHVAIATTRPELVPACIALGCHPDDDRYNHLIGSTAVTPLFRATVPIVAKEDADPTKGTGILMICTFGDTADVDDWRKLGVPAREIIDRSGRILPAPWGEEHWVSQDPEAARRYHDKLAGLSVNQARKEMVGLLTEEGLVEGEPEKISRPVKFYERGERPLEFVVTRQWFVRVLDKKDRLIEQGRKIEWHPDMFRRRYEDWVEGLNQDWCVSRQRYFGVPIPIWYEVRDDGSVDHDAILVPREEDLPVDPSVDAPPGYTPEQRGVAGGFVGDPDVFDTWGTSSLTPLIPTGWPHGERFGNLYPTDLRPQAHEIIRTWAFYTITRAMLEDGSVPWWHAAISGWVLDPERKKMSKSIGNVVLPTDLLDEFGSDSVRYWAGAARLGVDTATDPNVFREGKRLVTKLRNASRLVLGFEGDAGEPTRPLDRSLIARLATLIDQATARFDEWDHAGALEAIERWFWDDFCDNYLELSKSRAYDRDPSAIGTLRTALDVLLRLFAPYLPFVTEDIWNQLHPSSDSVHRASWPRSSGLPEGSDDGSFDVLVEVLSVLRRAKSEAKVSIKTPVTKLVVRAASERLELLRTVSDDLFAAGNVLEHDFAAGDYPELEVEIELGEPETKQPAN
jgi:valyl-tRNA synthetase